MALRALKTGGVTGLVVTASHNPVEDNGVKLIEPTGYMLDQAWEVSIAAFLPPSAYHGSGYYFPVANGQHCAQEWANKLAMAEDEDSTCAVIQELFRAEDIPYGGPACTFLHALYLKYSQSPDAYDICGREDTKSINVAIGSVT